MKISDNILFLSLFLCVHVRQKALQLHLYFCFCFSSVFWTDRQKLFPLFHLLLFQACFTSILGQNEKKFRDKSCLYCFCRLVWPVVFFTISTWVNKSQLTDLCWWSSFALTVKNFCNLRLFLTNCIHIILTIYILIYLYIFILAL